MSHFTIALVAIVIVFNFLFIPLWGITGAAVALFLAKLLYNFSIFLYVRNRYGLQPYNKNHAIILGIGFATFALIYFLPETANVFLNIGIKSSLTVILYCAGIYFTRVSPDVQELVEICKRKIFKN